MRVASEVFPIENRHRTIRFWLGLLVFSCVLPAIMVAAFFFARSYGVATASSSADVRQSLLLDAVVAALLLGLGIGLALIISRHIGRSIRALIGPASPLGSRGARSVAPVGIAEIDALGQALVDAALMLEQREREHREAERSAREMSVAKRSAEASAAANAQYRLLAEHSTDMIVRLDLDGLCRYVSPASQHILGWSSEELLGSRAADLVLTEDRAILETAFAALRAGEDGRLLSVRSRRRDGSRMWLEINFRLVRDAASNAPIEIVAIARDISKRQKIQEALSESQSRLQSILDNVPVAISLKDREHRYVVLNKQYEAWFGVTQEQQLGRTLREVGTDEEFAALMESIEDRVIATGTAHVSEVREPDIGTAPAWTLVTKFPIRTLGGHIAGVGTVNLDISERHAAQLALQEARDAAVAADQAKSAFLANMSHEIRTPMNGIIGFADLVLDSKLTAEQRERVTLIKDAASSLLAILNDILDVSKFEAGRLELERIPMSPVQVLDAAISIVRADALAKGLTLRTELGTAIPAWIEGDPTRLRQILLNLLSNAVKFTASGGITVAVSSEPSAGARHLRFAITDTGIGIPSDQQHLLFQNFSQVDRSITRRFGGTGLGLAISKHLAEAMGGTVGVDSEPGRGSTFWFTIALIETAAPAIVADTVAAGVAAASARILVAEDIDMNQLVIEGLLTAAGHRVTIVDNGAAALEAVRARDYDLILMDMEMPVVDGLIATRAIRGLDRRGRDIPIIALTANAMSDQVARSRAAGMNDHVAKPIHRETLLATIEKWLGNAAMVQPTMSRTDSVPVVDDEVLRGLERTIGKPKVAEIAAHFRDRLAETIDAIAAATDRERLAWEAHVLISVAGNLGCRQLMEAGNELIGALEEGRDDVAPLVVEITAAAEHARAAMDERYPP
jgi:PAS domain S-box-containing protein